MGLAFLGAVLGLVIWGIGEGISAAEADEAEEAYDEAQEEQALLEMAGLQSLISQKEEEAANLADTMGHDVGEVARGGAITLGEQSAGSAAGGAIVNVGSPLQLMTETALLVQEDMVYVGEQYLSQISLLQSEMQGYYEQYNILAEGIEHEPLTYDPVEYEAPDIDLDMPTFLG